LTVETLKKGTTLDFEMTDNPNVSRGTTAQDLPYSFSGNTVQAHPSAASGSK